MATVPTKPERETSGSFAPAKADEWPRAAASVRITHDEGAVDSAGRQPGKPSHRDALQALLAFSALHEQVQRRKALAARHGGIDSAPLPPEFEESEQFVLDEVLQLVAERAVAITGADGLAIALAENDELVLRAAAGTVRPDIGARIDRDSAFSGASFRAAQVVICDDTETDSRVNLQACRRLSARSMVAVPLCGRRRVIGLLEAFSSWPFAFNDSDVRNLTLLAELVVGALKPEDEDRFAQSAQAASVKLQATATRPIDPQNAVSVVEKSATPGPAVEAPAPKSIPPVQTTVAPAAKPHTENAKHLEQARVGAREIPVRLPGAVAPGSPRAGSGTAASPPPAQAAALPESGGLRNDAALLKAETAAAAKEPAIPAATASEVSAAAAKPIEKATAEPVVPAKIPVEVPPEAAARGTTVVEPKLRLGQIEAEPSTRVLKMVLLIGVVLLAAFAAGIWWKWRTGQLGSSIVTGAKTKAETSSSPQNTAPPANASSAPASENPSAEATQDLESESQEADTGPATPEEIAKFPKITGVRHWSSSDSTTVVLDLEDQVQYEAHRLTGPDRIYVDLHDTQLAPELAGKSIEIGESLLNRIRIAQPVAGMTRIVLETKANPNFSVSLEPNPYRLVIELRKIGAPPKGAINLFPDVEAEKKLLAIVIPPPTKEDLQLRARVPQMRIVVDAGHGGWDLGTVGRRGLLEKDLVLEIAERLGKLLQSRLGAEVIYTRQDDNYIPLDERAEIANQARADLFISVHANYSDLPSARGVETYYTNTFSAPGSKEAGAKDADSHASLTAKGNGTLTLTAADLHERIEQSRRLAASVQRALYGTLSAQNPGLRDRGVKEAGFVVLTESAMPGILAEVSFVSSPTDEQKLRSDGYREEIAEALYRGIARYAVNSRILKMAKR
jgi:N-acetylmuramoyl-L-alanine amidase/putative methionine-R-sulfoxide reductase with GAF domain